MDPLRDAEGAVDYLLHACAQVAAAGLGEHTALRAVEVVVAIHQADHGVTLEVVIVREHHGGLPGRSDDRATVTSAANGIDEFVVEPVLRVVQKRRIVEQANAGAASLLRQMG